MDPVGGGRFTGTSIVDAWSVIAFIQVIARILGFLMRTEIFLRQAIFPARTGPGCMDWTKLKARDEDAWDEAGEILLPKAEVAAKQKCPWLSFEDAEDAAIQAFLEMQKQVCAIPTVIPTLEDFCARLLACAKNRAVDIARKNKRLGQHVVVTKTSTDPGGDEHEIDDNFDPTDDLPYEVAIKSEDRELAQQLFAALEAGVKALLFDALVFKLKHRVIAAKNGWNTNAVGGHINNAVEKSEKSAILP